MNTEIQPFEFEGNKVRALADGDEVVFVASDIAKILGYRDAANLARNLDDDERGIHEVSTPNGTQNMTVLTESGLYRSILNREIAYVKEPEAQAFVKRFQRWVTHEVLPQIRRTGGYIHTTNTDSDEDILAKAVLVAQKTIEHKNRQIAEKDAQIKVLEPKALFADAVTAAKLAADSVQARNIVALAITADKLAANAVTTAKLKVTEDMTVALLNAHKIQAGEIAANAVTTAALAAGVVNADKLAANSVNASKIVTGAITADKLAANSITAVKIAAGSITTDKVAAGQFKGYVFTGAVFQSSEAADTGVKLNSTALQMWDSNHNQTVYLDGEGKSNVLTGTFQTRTSGHRIQISPDYQSYAISGSETFVGDGIEFPAYNGSTGYYRYPAIASVIQSSEVGTMSELDLWSGHVAKNDPGTQLRLQSRPRSKGATGSGITSKAYLSASTNWEEADASKKSSAWLDMEGVGGSGASAYLDVRSDSGSLCEIGVKAYGAKAKTWCTASDADGEVGVVSDISTGYVYLGGYLGGINGRHTFQSTNWRIYQNVTLTADSTVPPTTWSWTPAKFGRYHGVCNSDLNWGSIFMHVCNTGGAGSMQVMGYNAGTAAFHGDMYVNAIAWLTK